jgi:DNA-binding NtrC family response regulator
VANRILVVDDEVGIRHLLAKVLVDEGYQVESVGSAMDALAQLEQGPCDLAIVDLMLPSINGLYLAEAIRALDPGTPVILITAYGTPSFELMASHPAIHHYVHKPFTIEHLLSLIHRSLSGKESSR